MKRQPALYSGCAAFTMSDPGCEFRMTAKRLIDAADCPAIMDFGHAR